MLGISLQALAKQGNGRRIKGYMQLPVTLPSFPNRPCPCLKFSPSRLVIGRKFITQDDTSRCASRVLMWNLSFSRSVNLEWPCPSSSWLADGPCECSSRYRRRPSIRCSTDACLRLASSNNLVRRRDETGVSPGLAPSASNGGGSAALPAVLSSRSFSGRKSRRL